MLVVAVAVAFARLAFVFVCLMIRMIGGFVRSVPALSYCFIIIIISLWMGMEKIHKKKRRKKKKKQLT